MSKTDPKLYYSVWAWSTVRNEGGAIAFDIMHAQYEREPEKTICGHNTTRRQWESNGDDITQVGSSIGCKRCIKKLRALGFGEYLEPANT